MNINQLGAPETHSTGAPRRQPQYLNFDGPRPHPLTQMVYVIPYNDTGGLAHALNVR